MIQITNLNISGMCVWRNKKNFWIQNKERYVVVVVVVQNLDTAIPDV
jgi:hypothetical protein